MPAKDVTVTASYGVNDITATTTTEVKPVLGNDARVELDFTFIPGLSDMVEVDGNWQYAADGSDWENVSKYNNYAFNTFIPGYWRYTIDVKYKRDYDGMKFCRNGIVTVNGEEWERVASIATQASAYSPTYYLDSEGNVSVDLIEITKVSAKAVVVAIGNINSKMPLDKVERITSNEFKSAVKEMSRPVAGSVRMDSSISERKLNFSPEMDVRGERLNDAVEKVMRYVDDAIMLNVSSVRIIHGKGTGVLRDELQKLLRSMPGVASVKDEHIQFGGTGVTIVQFE
jgi:hypothetical protein